MQTLGFHDFFTMQIDGPSTKIQAVEDQLGLSPVELESEPDLVIRFGTVDESAELLLGDSRTHFGKTGDSFLVKANGSGIRIDNTWTEMVVDPDFSVYDLRRLIEGEVRRNLIQSDATLLHASSARIEGKTLLFPAWHNVGKTSVLFTVLRDGADYLGDDRIAVDNDAEAYGYDTPASIEPHMGEFLTENYSLERFRYRLGEFIDGRLNWNQSLGLKGIKYLNQELIQQEYRKPLAALFPESEFVERSSVDSLVFLETTASSRVSIDDIDPQAALSLLRGIRSTEWGAILRRYYFPFDSLFPNCPSKVDALRRTNAREDELLSELLEQLPIRKLKLPLEVTWDRQHRTKVLDALQNLLDSHAGD